MVNTTLEILPKSRLKQKTKINGQDHGFSWKKFLGHEKLSSIS